MYFDFEDRRPDTPILDRPLTRLEQVLLTIIAYLLIVIALIVYPRLPFVKAMRAAQEAALQERLRQQQQREMPVQYVFSVPKSAIQQMPLKRPDLSDETHRAQTMERAPKPTNDTPFSRGSTPDLMNTGAKPAPEQPKETSAPPSPPDPNALTFPRSPVATIAHNDPSRNPTLDWPAPGVLSDAIHNVQRYAQGETLQNLQGNGEFGPSIQFDTMGVDFGPWMRRFRAQIYRNWLVPYAAMSLHGHVVLAFNVHKDGTITDLQILQPSTIDAFTKAAFNAIKSSNPTVPFPQEYPKEAGQFIVTFYYNEQPPGGGGG
jgi:TonB family protein